MPRPDCNNEYSLLAPDPTYCNSSFIFLCTLHLSTLCGHNCRKTVRNHLHNTLQTYISRLRHLQLWPVASSAGNPKALCSHRATLFLRFPTNTSCLPQSSFKQSLTVLRDQQVNMVILRHTFFFFLSTCVFPSVLLQFPLLWLCEGLWFKRAGDHFDWVVEVDVDGSTSFISASC